MSGRRGQAGQGLVEYGLILALTSVFTALILGVFGGTLADDASAWRALPREAADWWRRRAESTIERDGDGWRVTGPASEEATVCLEAP